MIPARAERDTSRVTRRRQPLALGDSQFQHTHTHTQATALGLAYPSRTL